MELTATNDLTQPPKVNSEMVESARASILHIIYQLDLDIKT